MNDLTLHCIDRVIIGIDEQTSSMGETHDVLKFYFLDDKGSRFQVIAHANSSKGRKADWLEHVIKYHEGDIDAYTVAFNACCERSHTINEEIRKQERDRLKQ